MNILHGRTGRKVGEVDYEGNITTKDSELQAISEEITDTGGIIVPLSSEELEEGGIVDKVEFVPLDDERFVGALDQYLLGKGFYLHGED